MPGTGVSQDIGLLTNKVQDHSSALQALQVTVEHVARTTDRMYALAERHGDLAHELSRLRDVVDRAQVDTKSGDDRLYIAINNLATTIKEDRASNNATSDQVKRFKGALWGLGLATGLVAGLGMAVTTLYANNTNEKFRVLEARVEEHARTREKTLMGQQLRLDSLSEQIIEIRLSQQQRDRERSEAKP